MHNSKSMEKQLPKTKLARRDVSAKPDTASVRRIADRFVRGGNDKRRGSIPKVQQQTLDQSNTENKPKPEVAKTKAKKVIEIKLKVDESLVSTCPNVEWFKFVTCTISSCKNYTEETKRKCLALDRVRPSGAKFISDHELHLYKLRAQNISSRSVQVKRMKATNRIRAILVMKKYIEFIKHHNALKEKGVFTLPLIQLAEKKTWLRSKKLGWQNWMWEYFLDASTWEKFQRKHKHDLFNDAEQNPIELHNLLGMKRLNFDKLCSQYITPPTAKTERKHHDNRSQHLVSN